MKFRSILTFSPEMRTNTAFCLIVATICSLQSLISGVRILPNEKPKAIWNSATVFVTCQKDRSQDPGTLKWFAPSGQPVDDNNRAPVYVQESANSVKLFLMNTPKKHSGIYECKHFLDGKIISSDKFELKVYNAIKMGEGNRDSHIGTEGHSFSMPCFARFDSDSTEAQITWSHNNLPIKDREGQFAVTQTVTQSVNVKNVKSVLDIKHLTKENEGTYVCEAVYANPYLTDIKTIDMNLRVQFLPRFPENTRKNVWISDAGPGPIIVNITCLVNADPVAQFSWSTGRGLPLQHLTSKGVKHTIHSTENLSVLSLEYNDLNQIRNNFKEPDGAQRRFTCDARNLIGSAKMDFELNIGQLPEHPVVDKWDYKDGVLRLIVNESAVEPPIDIYRVDIDGNHQIYFNASNRMNPLANNSYEITVDVPHGTHQLIVFAHNPVGWSEISPTNLNPPLHLVVSGADSVQQYFAFLTMASIVVAVNAF